MLADADERADIVEEVDEEKHKDELAKADFCGGAEVEFEERAAGMREREQMLRPVVETQGNAGKRDGHDADEDGAADASSHEDGDQNQAGGSEQDLGIGGFAEADKGGGIGDDDFCVAQTDERDEQADARGGAMLEAVRDAVDDLLADAWSA